MNPPDETLSFSPGAVRLRQARRWLLLGVGALGLAGMFAGMLGNTKSQFFYPALVVHVDLSMLVWFLAFGCMMMTLSRKNDGFVILMNMSFAAFALGTLCIAASAFTGGEAYMSNYIPVIHHPLFFFGLSLLFCGVAGVIMDGGLRLCRQNFRPGIGAAEWLLMVSGLCFFWSASMLPPEMNGQIYYEYAFWGGGHVLQFVHTQFLLLSWLWLARAAGLRMVAGKWTVAILCVGFLAALAALGIYSVYPADSDEHRYAFTLLMKHLNGLAPLLLGGIIISKYILSPKASEASTLARIVLGVSMLLFFVGGALGYVIQGSNLIIPAHYHGSIVGITIAFMGVSYLLLPRFGFADISHWKLAKLQPLFYGAGQLCWIAGMAILGMHDVARKTPGSADTAGTLAAFLKHGGDGLSLIGGLLFVFVVVKAIFKKKQQSI